MDWAKAKNILIAALLATSLMLGIVILRDKAEEKIDAKETAENAVTYLKLEGASSICDVPLNQPYLPVLFISFQEKTEDLQTGSVKYKNYRTEQTGNDELIAVLISVGDNKAQVISAGSALLGILEKTGGAEGLEVTDISLVYHIEAENAQPETQDTAMPAWRFETNRGVCYINAYGQ